MSNKGAGIDMASTSLLDDFQQQINLMVQVQAKNSLLSIAMDKLEGYGRITRQYLNVGYTKVHFKLE